MSKYTSYLGRIWFRIVSHDCEYCSITENNVHNHVIRCWIRPRSHQSQFFYWSVFFCRKRYKNWCNKTDVEHSHLNCIASQEKNWSVKKLTLVWTGSYSIDVRRDQLFQKLNCRVRINFLKTRFRNVKLNGGFHENAGFDSKTIVFSLFDPEAKQLN